MYIGTRTHYTSTVTILHSAAMTLSSYEMPQAYESVETSAKLVCGNSGRAISDIPNRLG